MEGDPEKKKFFRLPFNKRKDSSQPLKVTETTLQIWTTFPSTVREDPSFSPFQEEHLRLCGNSQEALGLSNDAFINNEVTEMKYLQSSENAKIEDNSIKSPEENNLVKETEGTLQKNPKLKQCLWWMKMLCLLAAWLVLTGFLMTKDEHIEDTTLLSIPRNGIVKKVPIDNARTKLLLVSMKAVFQPQVDTKEPSNETYPILQVSVKRTYFNDEGDETYSETVSSIWKMDIVHPDDDAKYKKSKQSYTFEILKENGQEENATKYSRLNLHFKTSIDTEFPIDLYVNENPIPRTKGVIIAVLILCGLYSLIIWEIVNRTFAAVLASTFSIGILAALNYRPTVTRVIDWIDIETMLLLFGMMIVVAILGDTGLFDYLAVYCFKVTNGKVWPLINYLCFFTAILSAFLDNMTTLLLMTPVTIRLCEVMSLNPIPILMSMVLFSNTGGTLTPVGDPPNVIIASNSYIFTNGINFALFTLHMLPGVLLVSTQVYLQIRFIYRDMRSLYFKDSPQVEKLRQEIHVWKHAANSLTACTKEEDLLKDTLMDKVKSLKKSLNKLEKNASCTKEIYQETLQELQMKYPIRNKKLLIKCGVAMTFVMGFFFLQSLPEIQKLSLGWTSLLGAILIIILADIDDMESILAKVEWSTLLFFAALFVLMEALSEMGLIAFIGDLAKNVILSVGEESRLMVAILIILWVSALASAFVDNIPVTTMMVKVTLSLAQNSSLNLPLQPLVWALSFGACIGGNGTLIGASANVVCAGIAQQHGYKFTFSRFFKVGFPVMICSSIVATGYMLFTHCFFH